ncbi:MAG: TIR domain-containing protein [Rhodospirillaceae bacterium]|nr:TIR domain-containing protein [Rhodospirillaceae bacterium]
MLPDAPQPKPLIFISYSHKDETPWLDQIRSYLGPGTAAGEFNVWYDREVYGGEEWESEIQANLARCDICILLVSAHSTQSSYIITKEIEVIQRRRQAGDSVVLYPIILTPTPQAGLGLVEKVNWRPKSGQPLSSFKPGHELLEQLTLIADEISEILNTWRPPSPHTPRKEIGTHQQLTVDIGRLPDTPNQRLVGRDAELELLNNAWQSDQIHIVSMIAEGGVGKSALVNAWLGQMQKDGYRGASAVLGWSFYSQGSKNRINTADSFLDWAINQLDLTPPAADATARAKAIARAMMERRVLLILDGVEPLLQPLGAHFGMLRDHGLRTLLREVASQPVGNQSSLIVLTARAPIKDIEKWQGGKENDGPSRLYYLETLSIEAGAELLRDVILRGAPKDTRGPSQADLEDASRDFGGHALSLGLLGGYIRDAHCRNIKKRSLVRGLRIQTDNPGYDHARRVLESYVDEWLLEHPLLLSIMYMVGLFDRPADENVLVALRRKPIIPGLTGLIVDTPETIWNNAISLLRSARLLLDENTTNPHDLDAHPIIREFFGAKLEEEMPEAWRTAHGRIYDHLAAHREGENPELDNLMPLFLAIPHGVRAGRSIEALKDVYQKRICRRDEGGNFVFYASKRLGAFEQILSTLSLFFDDDYIPLGNLSASDQSWILGEASYAMRAVGKPNDAIPLIQMDLEKLCTQEDWGNAAIVAGNLSQILLDLGRISDAADMATEAIELAHRVNNRRQLIISHVQFGTACHQSGRISAAAKLFYEAEAKQAIQEPMLPRLYSSYGYLFSDILLDEKYYKYVCSRAEQALRHPQGPGDLLAIGLDTVTLARSLLHLAHEDSGNYFARVRPEAIMSVRRLRAAGTRHHLPRGLLVRAEVSRAIGDWPMAIQDLDEVLEIAEPGEMRLHMADAALERVRLCFARIDAVAPLKHHFPDIPEPTKPDAEEAAALLAEARNQALVARKLIDQCGYGRRSQAIADLEVELAHRDA